MLLRRLVTLRREKLSLEALPAPAKKEIMEYRLLNSAERQVSAIGQGTWNLEKSRRDLALAALRRGLELGMNHIDTAEMYGSGAVEELVGEAIAGRRDEVFLVSKVLPENASRNGTIRACERSLERLRTDRLDCYLLHWRGRYPLEEAFAAFEQLRHAGKILSWGVSNFDVSDLEEAHQISGKGHMVCNQVLYHLKQRAIEHAVLPWCEQHGIAVVAYSPFGQNDFPGPRTRGGRILKEIADTHNATPRQVALRFLLRDQMTFAIPKSSKIEHVEENAGASNLQLNEEEIARINKAFPLGRSRKLPTL